MNTKIEYLYRDADNYKVHNMCVVYGEVTDQQKEVIINSLEEGEYFIPAKVGLPERRFENYDPEVDHKWFELCTDSFDDTDLPPTVNITAAELADSFARWAGRWEEEEPDSSERPYVVVVTEISKRRVVVWAKGTAEAEEITNDLWNNSEIILDDSDFVESEFDCEHEAMEHDMELYPQYRKVGQECGEGTD